MAHENRLLQTRLTFTVIMFKQKA